MKPNRVAVGFRVKSGWATVVLMTGSVHSPKVLDRCILDLSEPDVPESRQPYHARQGTLEVNALVLRRRLDVVRRATKKSVTRLLKDFKVKGYKPKRAALVVGSLIEPDTIANPHIRAHALEGQLFRTVLAGEMKARGLSCSFVLERDAYASAAGVLGRDEKTLKRIVGNFGNSLHGPWRADEKVAALSAWMALV